MGPEGAVNIIYRKEIGQADKPEEMRKEFIEDYEAKFANPYIAAGLAYLDDVIEPATTRPHLIAALEMLMEKRQKLPPKKHGNIPL
jgi:acetyl-CoA carboxylase carboxyltransferase component